MKLTPEQRAERIARITRDVRREAYPVPPDPREPLIIGNPRPRSPVIVMRADYVALAEELAEVATLRTALAAAERERDEARAQVEALSQHAYVRRALEAEAREAALREALRKIRTNALDRRGVVQIRFAAIASTADAALSTSPPGRYSEEQV